jgi:hypothetical protein
MSSSKSEAAAELVRFLEKFTYDPEKGYPEDYRVDQDGTRSGTTLDGRFMKVSPQQWDRNLSSGRNGFPYFGLEKTKDEIIAKMRKLEDANQPDDVDAAGMPLFKNERRWRGFMLGIAEKIWEKSLNPPGLDLVEFPHRTAYKDYRQVDGDFVDDGHGGHVYTSRATEEVTWRYRDPQEGFVNHAYLAYLLEADNRKRGDRWQFMRLWVNEFVANNRSFVLNGEYKSMDDFTINGRPGTPGEFRNYWKQVSNPRYQDGGGESRALNRREDSQLPADTTPTTDQVADSEAPISTEEQ